MRSTIRIGKRAVDGLQTDRGRTILWDSELRGFGVVAMPSGRKSYIVNYRRPNGAYRRLTLGQHGPLTPDEARRLAKQRLAEIADGRDPLGEIEAEQRRSDTTFCAVAEDFIAKHVRKARSAKETERVIRTYLIPAFGDLQIGAIRRGDIARHLDAIETRQFKSPGGRLLGGPVMADNVLAAVRKLFNWYATRDDDFASPIVKGMARTKPLQRARDRVLSDDEIRALWVGLHSDDGEVDSRAATAVWAGLVWLLLLTGQRREEVAQMRFSEIDKRGTWTIPAERCKGGQANVIPLSRAALTLIQAQESFGRSDLVFTTNGTTPFSGFSKCKKRLDAAMQAHLPQRSKTEHSSLPEWRLHDLRRTARTLMVRAGVRPDIAERVLGHVISGVARVYDRYSYTEEKRDALERLGFLITKILAAPDGMGQATSDGGAPRYLPS
ncbi:MAG TPA: tyrosine-type recombinase/integrase [Rhizomicrobium sp.]|nr:tyrosine-type recombinase/integrase [Rhizomicrobium sp.]